MKGIELLTRIAYGEIKQGTIIREKNHTIDYIVGDMMLKVKSNNIMLGTQFLLRDREFEIYDRF